MRWLSAAAAWGRLARGKRVDVVTQSRGVDDGGGGSLDARGRDVIGERQGGRRGILRVLPGGAGICRGVVEEVIGGRCDRPLERLGDPVGGVRLQGGRDQEDRRERSRGDGGSDAEDQGVALGRGGTSMGSRHGTSSFRRAGCRLG